MLHGRNTIRVTSSERNEIDTPVCGDVGHVDPHPHNDALLFKVGMEVGII